MILQLKCKEDDIKILICGWILLLVLDVTIMCLGGYIHVKLILL